MKRILLVVSVCALLAVGVAVVGQALVVTQGVVYDPNGQVVDPTPLAVIASFMAAVGSIVSMPLCLAAGVWGLVTAAARNQYGWFVAIIGAGVLTVVGLFGMALVLLSAISAVAFVTPLALVALVALLYSLRPDPHTTRVAGAA